MRIFVFLVVLCILTAALAILRLRYGHEEVTTHADHDRTEVVSDFVNEAAAK